MVQSPHQKLKILVLMKRFGAGKDMVMQDFGRQIRLFENIAKLGHQVDFFVPDYKKRERKDVLLHKMNFYIRPYSFLKHFTFMRELESLIEREKYDCIVGSSDPLLGILGQKISRKFKIRYVYEMQDEYSSYASYKIPFVRMIDRKAVADSDIVITVSDSLRKLLKIFRKKPTFTIQNGIDLKSFDISGKKNKKKLGLPDGKIISYVGEISKFKGVDILMEAFKEVRRIMPNSYLLLSGPVIDVDIRQEGIIYRKFPLRKEVIEGLQVSDVAVLPNIRNRFSEYCFPYKLSEYMAAGILIVATKVGDVALILSKLKDSLCEPGDKYDMAEKIIKALKSKGRRDYSKILKSLQWEALSSKLLAIIRK